MELLSCAHCLLVVGDCAGRSAVRQRWWACPLAGCAAAAFLLHARMAKQQSLCAHASSVASVEAPVGVMGSSACAG